HPFKVNFIMMKNTIFAVLVVCSMTICQAQEETEKPGFPLEISVSNNGTVLPGSGYMGIISVPVHPGIMAGTFHPVRTGEKSQLVHSLKLGYVYHHYSHHAAGLYTDFTYLHRINSWLNGGAGVGIGYQHTFVDVPAFQLNESGGYDQKKNYSRSQFAGNMHACLSYTLNRTAKKPISVFLDYRFSLIAPFVKVYVPILPVTSVSLGTIFYLN
ncbi:MAG: hypothetical protein ABIJ16_04025, partial [Bacteroidota bacterium]